MKYLPLFLAPLLFFCSSCSDKQTSSDSGGESTLRKRNLRLVSQQNTATPIIGESVMWLTKRIEETSAQSLRFKVFDPDELVGSMEVLDAVSSGKVESGFSAAGFWMGKIPAAPLFSSFPFGPDSAEYISWFYYGNGMKLYQEMYDTNNFNVKVLLCSIIPPESSGWFAKPIESIEDLQGLKMRFYGLGGEVMKKIGVAVRLLPPSEIYPALEKGVIDATEFSMPSIDENLGFYKIAKYNYFPGWHQQATAFELLINKDVWNTLSKTHQAIIENACRANIIESIAVGEGTQGPVMKRNQERGVKQMTWSTEMIEQFRKSWYEVVSEKSKEDAFFKKVWDDLEKFRADYKEWGSRAYYR
jgi:TRAP-type mannitol/chloroaromatic compound transport system substrate-binding protein